VAHVARPAAKQIMVIVTDGNANLPTDEATAESAALAAAQAAKDAGVLVFGIAVGSEINQDFIEDLSSGPAYKFAVGDFSELEAIVQDIIDQACYQPTTIDIDDTTISCEESSDPSVTGEPTVTGWCHGCPPSTPTYTDSITAGSCPQEQIISRTWSSTDECSEGPTTVVQVITVYDHTAPTFNSFPSDATVECQGDTSTDALGDATAVDNCDPNPVVTYVDTTTPGTCPNEFTIAREFTASDACGNENQQTQSITVRDTTPPTITSVNNFCLWPPNHKFYCVAKSTLVIANDACSGQVYLQYLGCTSNQPDNGLGDGDTSGDCVYNSETETICFRSERAGTIPTDRIYTLHLAVVDDLNPLCANSVQTSVLVSVPHDQRNHPECRAPNSGK